jgi:hypothetical protein
LEKIDGKVPSFGKQNGCRLPPSLKLWRKRKRGQKRKEKKGSKKGKEKRGQKKGSKKGSA